MRFLLIKKAMTLLILVVTIPVILGWMHFKFGYSSSPKEGICTVTKALCNTIYEEATGKKLVQNEVNTALYLHPDELNELLGKFKGSPYEIPVFERPFMPDNHDIIWICIRSNGLSKKYENLDNNELKQMVFFIMQQFYQEKRGLIKVSMHVQYATPNRVCIAIPTTVTATEYLSNEIKRLQSTSATSKPTENKSLTEEIPEDNPLKNDTPEDKSEK